MKILLHICCGPCAIFPVEQLRGRGAEVVGYFYRSNIHPYTECLRREQTLAQWADQSALQVIYDKAYDLEGFLRRVVFREAERCRLCYHDRLRSAAIIARRGKFDVFTSTLLYSKFQRHALIREMGECVAREVGVPFHYEDFRTGWQAGITASKQLGMYRQQYCGCIYSEKERYSGRKSAGQPPPEQSLTTSQDLVKPG